MATQGPRFPVTVTTEVGPSGDNDWLTPSNVGADDASEAQITAATYDANDHSWRLKAQNFGFTIPSDATIDGITVEIERRAFAGAAEDQEVRLFDDTGTLVGDDKQKATAWPSTPTIDTYGGAADDWLPAGSWTPAQINDPDFGVALIVLATAANTDIGVDFIRVTITYTGPTTFFQTLAATAIGVAVFSDVVTFGKALPATAVGIAALTKGMFVTLAATAIGVAGLTKGMFKTLAATAVGVPALATALLTSVSMAATSIGVATMTRIVTFGKAVAATAVGVSVLTTQFIAGAGGGVTSFARWIAGAFGTHRGGGVTR